MGYENKVPDLPGLLDPACSQGLPHALFREVTVVNGKMTPPSAVVVPQMMVGIVAIRSQGQVFCAHTVRDVGASRCQKSRFPKGIGKAAEISREFVSKRVGFAHYLKTSVFRWGTLAFSSPGCQTLSPTESFLMLNTSSWIRDQTSRCFCVIGSKTELFG